MSSCPEDFKVISSLLHDMGISEYEDGVENLLLDFMDRYVTTLTEDCLLYSNQADKNSIDPEDVKLALELQQDQIYLFPEARKLAISHTRQNNNRFPTGLRLYPGDPDHCSLVSCDNRLKTATKKRRNVCTASRKSNKAQVSDSNYLRLKIPNLRSSYSVKKEINPITSIAALSTVSSTSLVSPFNSFINTQNLVPTAGILSDVILISNDEDKDYANKEINPIASVAAFATVSSTSPVSSVHSSVNAQNLMPTAGILSDVIQLSNDVNPNKRPHEEDKDYANKEINPVTSVTALSPASSNAAVSPVNSSVDALNLMPTVGIQSDEIQVSNDVNPNKRPHEEDDDYALSPASSSAAVNTSVNAQNLVPTVGILSDEIQVSNDVISNKRPHERDHDYALSPASSTAAVNTSVNAQNLVPTVGILSDEIQVSNDVNPNKRPHEEDDDYANKEINPITSVAALSTVSSTSPVSSVNNSVNAQNLISTVKIPSDEIQVPNDVNPNKRPRKEEDDDANKEMNPITSIAAVSPVSSVTAPVSPVNSSVDAQSLMPTVGILSDEIPLSTDVNPNKRPHKEDERRFPIVLLRRITDADIQKANKGRNPITSIVALSPASSTAPVSPANSSVDAPNMLPTVGILSDEIQLSIDINPDKRPHEEDDKYADKEMNPIISIAALSLVSSTAPVSPVNSSVNANDGNSNKRPHEEDGDYDN